MNNKLKELLIFIGCLICLTGYAAGHKAPATAAFQQSMTPDHVLTLLKQGNNRFSSDQPKKIDYLKNVSLTTTSQHPVAIVLSCIDSRVPPEVIFNQPIGNIFVTRTAANVINADVIGGLEFATKASGAKLIVVMGHDRCGAIRGACQNVKMGKLTQLLDKIQPAISETESVFKKRECKNYQFINAAAKNNVLHVMKLIPQQSEIINKMVHDGQVKIVGAMYHLDTGKVTFLN